MFYLFFGFLFGFLFVFLLGSLVNTIHRRIKEQQERKIEALEAQVALLNNNLEKANNICKLLDQENQD